MKEFNSAAADLSVTPWQLFAVLVLEWQSKIIKISQDRYLCWSEAQIAACKQQKTQDVYFKSRGSQCFSMALCETADRCSSLSILSEEVNAVIIHQGF